MILHSAAMCIGGEFIEQKPRCIAVRAKPFSLALNPQIVHLNIDLSS
jgi:hypothetical protein